MSALMGVLMGTVYIKRGYETAVLGHTLGDWTGLLFRVWPNPRHLAVDSS